MMHIRYKLAPSSLHGIGLFTQEDIQKGQLVYSASPLLDTRITDEQFAKLNESEKREVQWWGFRIPQLGVWHVDFDVSKFINHSLHPTVTQDTKHNDAYLLATRHIVTGEEITQNYLEFETYEDLNKRGIRVEPDSSR